MEVLRTLPSTSKVIECWQLLLKSFLPGKETANHCKLLPEGDFAPRAKKANKY